MSIHDIKILDEKETRAGFGDGILEAGRRNPNVVALTADLAGSLKLNAFIKEFPDNDIVKIVNGMYGPYIQIGKRNVKIPKGQKPEDLTLEECLALGDAAPVATKKRKK